MHTYPVSNDLDVIYLNFEFCVPDLLTKSEVLRHTQLHVHALWYDQQVVSDRDLRLQRFEGLLVLKDDVMHNFGCMMFYVFSWVCMRRVNDYTKT